jgi:hypothetical protein
MTKLTKIEIEDLKEVEGRVQRQMSVFKEFVIEEVIHKQKLGGEEEREVKIPSGI